MVIERTPSEMQGFSLEELSEQVEALLKEQGLIAVQQDHRVSAAPDVRTIRYYTTLGLLDRPIIEGRIARYKKRHLLQLLAIKALQVLSLPLAEVQSRLYGLSDTELEAVIAAVASSVKDLRKASPNQAIKPAFWREIVIVPGLKIMAEEGWEPGLDDEVLIDRIRAAFAVFKMARKKADGGSTHEHSGN